ncbi:hypothetical protein RQM59_03355 [Flavobacteriaceae bacterium S356]|uniref:Uncharacterized protein n=1 Tax=Asprobacillus argus TaxID=3076534 RepID=A0ABU3LCE9_9FLAO|nr:hypothetical protein [Flavobacteriaceae bacterium S356]
MIKLSKTFLLVLMVLMVVLGAISYRLINWEVFHSGTSGAIKELRLTLVFFGLGLYFLFPYVKRIKKSNNK